MTPWRSHLHMRCVQMRAHQPLTITPALATDLVRAHKFMMFTPALAMYENGTITITPTPAVHQGERARYHGGRVCACDSLELARVASRRSHLHGRYIGLRVHGIMTAAPQLAMRRRSCACHVRACCVGVRTATCNASAVLRLQCARMLR